MGAATSPRQTLEALLTPGADLGIAGHPAYGYLGFLESVLRRAESSEVLFAKGFKERSKRLSRAMVDGACELQRCAEADALQVVRRGQLPLCWPGTTLLRGTS